MAGGKNLGVRLKNKYFKISKEGNMEFILPQIYVPNFVIDWAEKRMKDLTKEAEAIIKKLRGGFGSFGEISDENEKEFCYGDINDFINKANHYIEENPEEKNKIRKMIKNIEKEVIDLKACNIISKDIDFRQVGYEGYKLYNSCNKEYETILKKIKDFKKQYKKTKMYVRSNDTFNTKRNKICEVYKTNIENFEKQLEYEEAFFRFESKKTINEKIREKFEDKRDIVFEKISDATISNSNKEYVTQFDPFQAINDPEIFKDKPATYSEKIELFLKNILTQIISKYKQLKTTRNARLDKDIKNMMKAEKKYAKNATNLLSEIESFYGELCEFLNDNKSFVKELNKQNIEYKKIYDCFMLIKKLKLDVDKTFTEYVYKKSLNTDVFGVNYAKELADIKFYLQDCEKLIDDFYKKVGNPRTKFKDLKKAIKDLYDKSKGLDAITDIAFNKIVLNKSWNGKDDYKVEMELESKLNNIQICCTKIKDFGKELQKMKKKFDDSQKPQKKALRFALNVFQKISQFAFVGYKTCSVAKGNIGDLKDIVNFMSALTDDYLNTDLKK